MRKKLSVENLVVSFRTHGGKVQAVRNISFHLNQGETLALVGESGSGKSVTSKAILGILAGNSVVEGGSILYDGMDLLRISEEEFYSVRGDKIAMIFQDPMSSLNPIMRIGKQLTEAMLLKGRIRQKSCRKAFNSTLSLLSKTMVRAIAKGDVVKAAKIKKQCKDFDKSQFKHIALKQAYSEARESSAQAVEEIGEMLFHIEKEVFTDQRYFLGEIQRLASGAINDYVVGGEDKARLQSLLKELQKVSGKEIRRKEYPQTSRLLKEISVILEQGLAGDEPDFFSMGYYMVFAGKSLPRLDVLQLNQYMKNYMDENFMDDFQSYIADTLEFSAKEHVVLKARAVEVLEQQREMFGSEGFRKGKYRKATREVVRAVEASIDKLEIRKDTLAYTFGRRLRAALSGCDNNSDSRTFCKEAVMVIDQMIQHYKKQLNSPKARDYEAETEEVIAFFKEKASGAVQKITGSGAKYKALKLMEEVGISDARKRFRQYPFEFSGGMRQRIVIAIALAADPDILICDEPTTALDVTIQAQILELINKLKENRHLSILFITHDLGVVAYMADRIAVMYAGKIVEIGTCEEIFYAPAHPYTWALLSAMPDVESKERLEAIPGTPPNMLHPPVGDAFAERNQYALKIDFEKEPPMFEISKTHRAATWLLHPDAPKVEPPESIVRRTARRKEG